MRTALTTAALALTATGYACSSGCSGWKAAGPGIAACVAAEVDMLVPTVAAALNAPNWDKQMGALEGMGVNTAVCAVEALLKQLGATGPDTSARSFATSQNTLLVTHAHAYLTTHGK